MFILLRFTARPAYSSIMETLKNSCDLLRRPEGEHLARSCGQIGVTQATIDGNGRLAGWSFLIPLKNYSNPANAVHLEGIPPAFLSGRYSNPASKRFIEHILSASEATRFNYKCILRYMVVK